MPYRQVSPITYDDEGVETFNLAADAANANWLYAARLARAAKEGDEKAAAELAELFDTPMYEYAEEG